MADSVSCTLGPALHGCCMASSRLRPTAATAVASWLPTISPLAPATACNPPPHPTPPHPPGTPASARFSISLFLMASACFTSRRKWACSSTPGMPKVEPCRGVGAGGGQGLQHGYALLPGVLHAVLLQQLAHLAAGMQGGACMASKEAAAGQQGSMRAGSGSCGAARALRTTCEPVPSHHTSLCTAHLRACAYCQLVIVDIEGQPIL
jgi:hypothetical protein